MSQPPPPPSQPAAATRFLVVGAFDDEVRAAQAVEALQVWRRARRELKISPIAVAGRRSSGSTTSRTRGVLRPRRGAWVGLLAGLILFALPAAGAAAFVGWALGSVVLGLGGLIGLIPGDQVGLLVLEMTAGSAVLAALIAGVFGALAGLLVGLIAGLIDTAARGLSHAESARTLAMLDTGSWAAVARVRAPSAAEVRDELARLGAVATVEAPVPAMVSASASASPQVPSDQTSDRARIAPGSGER